MADLQETINEIDSILAGIPNKPVVLPTPTEEETRLQKEEEHNKLVAESAKRVVQEVLKRIPDGISADLLGEALFEGSNAAAVDADLGDTEVFEAVEGLLGEALNVAKALQEQRLAEEAEED